MSMHLGPSLGQRLAGAGRAFFGAMPPPPPTTFRPVALPARGSRRTVASEMARGYRAAQGRPGGGAKPNAAPITSSNDPASIQQLAGALAGGQATRLNPDRWMGMSAAWIPPSSPEEEWRSLRLDETAIGDYPPHKLVELLMQLSPEIARAVWDNNRMLCGDWAVACYDLGTKNPNLRAQASVKAFIDRLTERHGSFETVLVKLFTNAFLRGAIFAELVLDASGRQALDLVCPDPATARFKEIRDPATGGTKYQLGQVQDGKFVVLEHPTIRYIPLETAPGSPYALSPVAPALFPALFMLAMMHDIRRVVAQQGYPRLDIAIDFDAMIAAMPPEAAGDIEQLAAWCQRHINDVVAIYSKLPPDAAYVHASTITVNKPVGAVDADSLGGINGLITGLERMLVRALKTMPLLMGISDGVSEANANRQWEIQLSSLRYPQRLVAQTLERFFSLALRAEGIQATVDFTFKENRKSEEQRDQQVLELKIKNATEAYKAGFIDQNEASQMAVGHDAAEKEPRAIPLDPNKVPPGGTEQVTTDGGNKGSTPRKNATDRAADTEGRTVAPRNPVAIPREEREEREAA